MKLVIVLGKLDINRVIFNQPVISDIQHSRMSMGGGDMSLLYHVTSCLILIHQVIHHNIIFHMFLCYVILIIFIKWRKHYCYHFLNCSLPVFHIYFLKKHYQFPQLCSSTRCTGLSSNSLPGQQGSQYSI